MGSVDLHFVSALATQGGLRRAVETGTYRGRTARSLATIFPEVVTIELSAELHREAAEALRDTPAVQALPGHSAQVLRDVRDATKPSLFFLDGHWSGGATAGADDECPVLEEIEVIAGGHPGDCLVIDDAQLFTSAPPPPHKPEAWPTLVEVFDTIRRGRPEHFVTLIADQVIAVPGPLRGVVDAYGLRVQRGGASPLMRLKGAAFSLRERVRARR
jgi:hypothetical protein